jgi:hypothetical protein
MDTHVSGSPVDPLKVEVTVRQLEMQLLFDIDQASRILGGMPPSTIRTHVQQGRLQRCTHIGDRPWYFTMEELQSFVRNHIRA